jgi:soluble cytochrome b562
MNETRKQLLSGQNLTEKGNREMEKRKLTLGMLILGFLFIFPAASHADIKKDFAAFDRAFIPPLAITNQEKVKPSRKAMKILMQNWEAFKAKYYESNPEDAEWKEDFDRIDRQIQEAAEIVKSGKDLMSAHETLEEIRIITLELRKRNNIDYFLDPLTDFHVLMEQIFHTGKDNSPEDLDKGMIDDLKEAVAEAEALWRKIGEIPFDKELYGFTDAMVAQMNGYLKAEAAALANVNKAIESGDKKAIVKAAKGVKTNYAQMYKMFGDFDRLKK